MKQTHVNGTKKSTHTPTVIFGLPTIPEEARTLVWFCLPRATGWDWSHKVYVRHPELKSILDGVTDPDKMYTQCLAYARAFRTKNTHHFNELVHDARARWHPFEARFLSALAEHFDVAYPPHRKFIRAYISMVPIYPRELDTWSFNVGYFIPERVCAIAFHEILHFMYFRAWAREFPETKSKEYESPHLVWRLSEILDPIILSEHPVFASMLEGRQSSYPEFEALHIGTIPIMKYFTHMYRTHLANKKPFATFLRDASEVTNTHQSIFMKA